MKLKSFLALSSVVALAIPAANAQTVIRITASNGDRGPTQTAISKILASGWTFNGIDGYTTSAGSQTIATGANFGAWNGTWAGNQVIIKVSYSGALAGLAATASDPAIEQRYVASNGTNDMTVVNPITTTDVSKYENAPADFGFSTNFQSTSPFKGQYNGWYYQDLTEENVGVSALGFYASPGFPTDSANITTQQAQLLYRTGSVPLSLFTGRPADATKKVYAIGRNTDAGQRFGAYTEVGLGTATTVKVWQPAVASAVTSGSFTFGGTASTHIPWPAETVSGIYSPEGSGGFQTGASLAPILTTTITGAAINADGVLPAATEAYYIGYVTPGDALTRILGVGTTPLADSSNAAYRGVALSYNGVPLHNAVNGPAATVNSDNVRNGKYTAWLYNRIVKSPTFEALSDTNVKKAFSNALRDQIFNTDAVVGGGIKIDSNFKVERTEDGGAVTPL